MAIEHRDFDGQLIEVGDTIVYAGQWAGLASLKKGVVQELLVRNKPYSDKQVPKIVVNRTMETHLFDTCQYESRVTLERLERVYVIKKAGS